MPMPVANSRRDVEVQSFPPIVPVLVPLLALGLQAYLPLHFRRFVFVDLPLIVAIYFSIARRSPILGALIGAAIGLAQDGLTHLPLGINGIAKSLVCFLAASLGVRIDVENHGTRLILNFVFSLAASAVYWFVVRRLLGLEHAWSWVHEVVKAVVNALIAVILFALLDRTRREA